MTKTIHLHYFAVLREERGLSIETITTEAETPAALYQMLRSRYMFTLPAERVRVAVNDEFVPWTTTLDSGSRVMFIPPVAGG